MAETFFKRIRGLLARKEFGKGEALIIKPCNSIHTFFMRFSIDVLFVDKNNAVIEAISNLRPFRVTRTYFNVVYVVELPEGVVESSSTCVGDILSVY